MALGTALQGHAYYQLHRLAGCIPHRGLRQATRSHITNAWVHAVIRAYGEVTVVESVAEVAEEVVEHPVEAVIDIVEVVS